MTPYCADAIVNATESPRISMMENTMAQKVQVLLVDDVDGGAADETVTFGLDGVT